MQAHTSRHAGEVPVAMGKPLPSMKSVMRFASLFVLVGALGATVYAVDIPLGSSAHATGCPVTSVQDIPYGNEALQVVLPQNGKFVFQPGGPGFVDHDGALGIKIGWERLKKGQLRVGGRKLNGPAPPARAYIYDYGDIGFQPMYLVFPTPGCWEITGAVANTSLTFVVLVEKIGHGPSWQFEGPPQTWRVTTDSGAYESH